MVVVDYLHNLIDQIGYYIIKYNLGYITKICCIGDRLDRLEVRCHQNKSQRSGPAVVMDTYW